MRPKISVVLATYNGEKYIVEQLDSIRLQTRPVDEVVICDDRSSDNTVQIMQDYIKEYGLSGWTVEVNEKNLGFGSNFYKAAGKATGEYVFFSDQDDIWMTDKLEKMVGIMEEKPEIKVLCSEYEIFATGQEIPEYAKNYGNNNKKDKSLHKVPLTPANFFIGSLGCDMCVRGDFLFEIKPYWFRGWAQDEYVWKLSQCVEGCYMYHEELIRHRVHASNVTMHKIHDINKRIAFIEDLKRGNEACRKYVEATTGNRDYLKIIDKNIKSETMRIDMLKNCKLLKAFPLLFYGKYYHSRKSLLMEPWIAFKQRKNVKK